MFELQTANLIPFSWGSKGDILFPWKENIPLNRPPARCRGNPALSGDFDSLCHIGTKINRLLRQRQNERILTAFLPCSIGVFRDADKRRTGLAIQRKIIEDVVRIVLGEGVCAA